MRVAQRGGSIPEQTEQQVEVILGTSPGKVGVMLSEMVARYAIKVVALTAIHDPDSPDLPHGVIVVFEEES